MDVGKVYTLNVAKRTRWRKWLIRLLLDRAQAAAVLEGLLIANRVCNFSRKASYRFAGIPVPFLVRALDVGITGTQPWATYRCGQTASTMGESGLAEAMCQQNTVKIVNNFP